MPIRRRPVRYILAEVQSDLRQELLLALAQLDGVLLAFLGLQPSEIVDGLAGHELYADYNASKAGVILLARTMARVRSIVTAAKRSPVCISVTSRPGSSPCLRKT